MAHRDFPGSSIYECRNCSLLFTFPLPDPDALNQYYQEKYPLPDPTSPKGTPLADKHRGLAEGQYHFVVQYHPAGQTWNGRQVLEVGCGPGFLLRRFAEAGANCLGIELDARAVEYCRSQHHIEVQQVSLEEFQWARGPFDLILLSHVFEHFRMPLKVLGQLHQMLRDDGMIFLEVPREDGRVMRMKQRYRLPYASHLFFYGDRALRAMVKGGCFFCLHLVSCGPRVEEFYMPRPSIWKRALRRFGLLPPPSPKPSWDWNITYPEGLMVGKNLRALLVKDLGREA